MWNGKGNFERSCCIKLLLEREVSTGTRLITYLLGASCEQPVDQPSAMCSSWQQMKHRSSWCKAGAVLVKVAHSHVKGRRVRRPCSMAEGRLLLQVILHCLSWLCIHEWCVGRKSLPGFLMFFNHKSSLFGTGLSSLHCSSLSFSISGADWGEQKGEKTTNRESHPFSLPCCSRRYKTASPKQLH